MTTKNIQDVVAETAERIASRMDGRTVTSHQHYRDMLAKELSNELTQLVKEVEAGEYKSGVEQTIAQFLRINLENPKAPVNVDEVKRRALSERV